MWFDFFTSGSSMLTADERARLARIERKLDAVIAHLGIAVPGADEGLSADVRELAEAGRKIEAIKLYRERTGAGLAEAKRAVEEHSAGR